MTLIEALRIGTGALDRMLRAMGQVQRGAADSRQLLTGVPANLADIIRDAEVHRRFIAGPPSAEMQRVLHDALFHPPTFRALGPPGVLPGPPHPELTRVIFEALFHPVFNPVQRVTPAGTPPRRLG
jgi:hypothetical protein